MEKLANIHPGEILIEEFLIPLKISAYRLSKDIGIPQTRISQIIKGNRRITADTALRLSSYFGNTPKFWLGLQDDYDIEEERQNKTEIFRRIRTMRKNEFLNKEKINIYENSLEPMTINELHKKINKAEKDK
ncbi:MAG: HigA family addiction module antidote protein [Bacteroidales bacterium]|nr:HigA family addiction module antidote protein [Bacteroidales bacterium]